MTESHNHSTNSTTAGDLESNETTPLLHSLSKTSSKVNVKSVEPGTGAVTVRVVIQEAASPQENQELSEEEERRRMRQQVAKYVLWFVLGGVALGLLVKGIVDSGDSNFDLKKALKSALGGGLSGAAAMVLQVLALMPLRTVMNYQYRYGTTTSQAVHTLYADGGFVRYYQGLSAALIQGPVSRFGDTAANSGVLALLNSNGFMKRLPELVKTLFSSIVAAGFRIVLTPVDTVKTTLQTQGKRGMKLLRERVRVNGIGSLWYGALATAAATFVGHYPWFSTYNFLQANLPESHTFAQKLLRQAFIGFCASVVSDTSSNSLRVVKTYRQVNETKISYTAAARNVVATDGWRGLFGRGLKTRILANGLQSVMFSVLWKLFMDIWDGKSKA